MPARQKLAILWLAVAPSCLSSVDLGGSPWSPCHPCTTDAECGAGAACASVGGAPFCAILCPMGTECPGGTSCTASRTQLLDETNACLSPPEACGGSPTLDGGRDVEAGGDGPPAVCGYLVGPSVPAPCTACKTPPGNCQPNGCYNGWYCDVGYRRCDPPPSYCDDGGSPYDGSFE